MPERINRAIELLEQGQPVYYVGTSEVTYDAGREMAGTWADYINVSMEHGTLDLPGLAAFMRGLKDGGPTRSGHATPAVIVDLPPDGSSEAVVRANAWMFKQTLDRASTAYCSVTWSSPVPWRRWWRRAAIRSTPLEPTAVSPRDAGAPEDRGRRPLSGECL